MGLSIRQSEFSGEEFERFAAKVRTDLTALTRLLDRPGFGEGESSIGAEVEFYIVNSDLRVQPINTDIAASVQDPQLTVELNRFNLEYNLSPQAFKGNPFARTEQELLAAIQRINRHAAPLNGELVKDKKGKPSSYGRFESRVRKLPFFNSEFPVATLAEEILTPGDGQIRAMITIAGNPVLSAPGGGRYIPERNHPARGYHSAVHHRPGSAPLRRILQLLRRAQHRKIL